MVKKAKTKSRVLDGTKILGLKVEGKKVSTKAERKRKPGKRLAWVSILVQGARLMTFCCIEEKKQQVGMVNKSDGCVCSKQPELFVLCKLVLA